MIERQDDVEREPARPPAIAIVGNDVLLAARPASAVQLAHGLARLGFDAAVPASWGDELVASACLARCAEREGPMVLCSCPLVAERLLASGADLSRFLIPLVTPAVAVARYLRRIAGPARPRVTYLGACPGATGEEIDERLTPDELFERLADAGLILAELPSVFESVIPPDRRRTLSLPGGAPTAEALRRASPARTFVELGAGELADELAQHLLSGETVLVDPAPHLGCACSGACNGVAGRVGRAAVAALEPPRSTTSAVDLSLPIELDTSLPSIVAAVARQPLDERPEALEVGSPTPPDLAPLVRPRQAAPAKPPVPLPPGKPEPRSGGRLRSPALGVPRFQNGSPPVSRTGEGRALPRAYVAHRRTPPGSRRVSSESSRTGSPEPVPPGPTASPAAGAPAQIASDDLHLPAFAPVPPELAPPEPSPPPAGEATPPASAEAPERAERPAPDTPLEQATVVEEPLESAEVTAVEGSHEREKAAGTAHQVGTPGRIEPSPARLLRERTETARVVPRYEPRPRGRRRVMVTVLATAVVALVAVALAADRREPQRTESSGIMAAPAESAGAAESAPAGASPADATRDGAAATRGVVESEPLPATGAPATGAPVTGTAASARATPAAAGPRPAPTAAGAPAAPPAATPPRRATPGGRARPAAAPPAARAETTARQATAADSAAARQADELAEIRRELERRRARIDSLARFVDSIPARARPRPTTPPR